MALTIPYCVLLFWCLFSACSGPLFFTVEVREGAVATENITITVSVEKHENCPTASFKVKPSTAMQRLMESYCSKHHFRPDKVFKSIPCIFLEVLISAFVGCLYFGKSFMLSLLFPKAISFPHEGHAAVRACTSPIFVALLSVRTAIRILFEWRALLRGIFERLCSFAAAYLDIFFHSQHLSQVKLKYLDKKTGSEKIVAPDQTPSDLGM